MGGIERERMSQRIHQCLSSVSDVALPLSFCLALSPALPFSLSISCTVSDLPCSFTRPSNRSDLRPCWGKFSPAMNLTTVSRKDKSFRASGRKTARSMWNEIAPFFHLDYVGKPCLTFITSKLCHFQSIMNIKEFQV